MEALTITDIKMETMAGFRFKTTMGKDFKATEVVVLGSTTT